MEPTTAEQQLRRLFPGELLPHRPLPGNLYDRHGGLLAPRGTVLAETGLGALAEHGAAVYAGPDWEPSESQHRESALDSPEELLQTLHRQHRGGRGAPRCRRFARHKWRTRLSVLVQECSKGITYRRRMTVAACDLSAHGFAFTAVKFLHPGTVVYARFVTDAQQSIMKGIVRNCVYLGDRQHRIGVEFIARNPSERTPEFLELASGE